MQIQEDPVLTIGIPVLNRNPMILKTLDSIVSFEFDLSKVKLIIADGLSTDGTYEAVHGWIEKNGPRFRSCLSLRLKSNDSEARNACIREMEGEYFLTMDSDVVFPPKALKYALKRMRADEKIGIVALPYDLDERKASLVIRIVIHQAPRKDAVNTNIGMGFSLFRKETLNEVGLFNEQVDSPNETEYSQRVARSNFKILVCAEMRGIHLKVGGEPTLSFLKRCFYQRPRFFLRYTKAIRTRTLTRLAYFGFLPVALALGIFFILQSNFLLGLLCFAYCFPAAFKQVRKTFGVKYKLIATFFVPTYISIEFWGLLWYLVKSRFAHSPPMKQSNDE